MQRTIKTRVSNLRETTEFELDASELIGIYYALLNVAKRYITTEGLKDTALAKYRTAKKIKLWFNELFH